LLCDANTPPAAKSAGPARGPSPAANETDQANAPLPAPGRPLPATASGRPDPVTAPSDVSEGDTAQNAAQERTDQALTCAHHASAEAESAGDADPDPDAGLKPPTAFAVCAVTLALDCMTASTASIDSAQTELQNQDGACELNTPATAPDHSLPSAVNGAAAASSDDQLRPGTLPVTAAAGAVSIVNAKSDRLSGSATVASASTLGERTGTAAPLANEIVPQMKAVPGQGAMTATAESDGRDLPTPSAAAAVDADIIPSEVLTQSPPRNSNPFQSQGEIKAADSASTAADLQSGAIGQTGAPSRAAEPLRLATEPPLSPSHSTAVTPANIETAKPAATALTPAESSAGSAPPAGLETATTPSAKAPAADINAVIETDKDGRHRLGPSPDASGRLPGESNALSTARLSPSGPMPLEALLHSALPGPANQTAANLTGISAPVAMPTGAPIALTDLPLAIALQTKSGKSRFTIRLDPPELGRIDVRLDIDTRSSVTLRLVAERPETLDLLRRDGAHIERALQDAGLKVDDQTLQFSLHDRSHDDPNSGENEIPHYVLVQDDRPPAPPRGYLLAAGLGGGLDIRV